MAALYLSSATAAFGVTGYLTGQVQLEEQAQRIDQLQQVTEARRASRELSQSRLRQMLADLEHIGSQQRETIESLTELQSTLESELAATREELELVTRERDAALVAAARERETARQLASSLPAIQEPGEEELGRLALARSELAGRIATLETQLAAATGERDSLKRTEKGLRWRVELLETRLTEMRQSVSAEAGRMRQWIVKQVSALEGVLATSGIDVDRLIERVDTRLSTGQGGPLEPVPATGARGSRVAFQPALTEELSRLHAVHALLQAMPLVPPMVTYRTTSPYGVRRDPIAGRPAMHTGLDFGGPSKAKILATAPGKVVSAGPAGAYGIMVEIDHGMGIRTRYGHLRKVLVKAGERVKLHDPVGIMGSTGRSTGEHLHYEVRIDGVAYDPAQFLQAGKDLRDVFKG